ncbi:hypothetical protein VB620_01995 [Nodularia harveyana UHCC-0300]|uniref:Uncharacterized protein n=1 Tax=Nodularia harveyana UHCC-0300 TaxID=2974287 RepID=A0ABU5U998_9CYAN|nr:hypothetical protein [Nodularia harveyana]MEA5580109.1 hypothetical protein [Nodularia harveyana UHCC-0300]
MLQSASHDWDCLETENGDFLDDAPTYREAPQKWHQQNENINDYCGLMITQLVITRASCGRPL